MYAMNVQIDVIGLVLRKNCKSKQMTDIITWPSRCHGRIFHCKQTHFTTYFPKQRDIIVFISDDRHWPSTIASQYISFRVGQRMSNDELTQ